MNRFNRFLKWVDSMAPDPWIVEGVVQTRPVTQLGFFIGVVVTLLVIYLFSLWN